MLTGYEYILVILAAFAAGAINALAGGGTLVTFPTLMAVGIPPISANVTNTIALCPGYLGATMAQWQEIKGQKQRAKYFIPAGAVGGILGGILLLNTGEKLFSQIVPFLILLASALLAAQDPLRAWLLRRRKEQPAAGSTEKWAAIPVGIAGIYGGYFGAGLSVIVLAVLGMTVDDNLTRLNALKQTISFSVNVAAAIFFLFSGKVVWGVALLMMVGALAGGAAGGKLAGRIKPATLRWIVVSIGFIVGTIYLIRAFT